MKPTNLINKRNCFRRLKRLKEKRKGKYFDLITEVKAIINEYDTELFSRHFFITQRFSSTFFLLFALDLTIC